MSTVRFHLRVEPKEIVYINGILDSYENLGCIRTADEKTGFVTLYTDSSTVSTVEHFLAAICKEGLYVAVEERDCIDAV